MDLTRLGALLRSSGIRPRRGLLGLLAGGGLGLLGVRPARAACAANGARCGRAGDLSCCSGVCKRKRGTRKRTRVCRRAPGQSICTVEQNSCQGVVSDCGVGGTTCLCYVTVRGASFCGESLSCVACDDDGPCVAALGRGAVCISCPSCGSPVNFRGCVLPCSDPV